MKKIFYIAIMVPALIMITVDNMKGQSVKETRNTGSFSEVSFGISGNLYIRIGSPVSVIIEGDRDYVEDIETYVKDDKLIIRKQSGRIFRNVNADCHITMPSISGLSVSGSGRARIDNDMEADVFRISVSGSGKAVLAGLTADSFYCTISGSGDAVIEGNGEADRGNITISGSGSFQGAGFEVDKLTVNISGSGGCDCMVGDELTANVSGSGNVWYKGNPRLNVRASGSGRVRSK